MRNDVALRWGCITVMIDLGFALFLQPQNSMPPMKEHCLHNSKRFPCRRIFLLHAQCMVDLPSWQVLG